MRFTPRLRHPRQMGVRPHRNHRTGRCRDGGRRAFGELTGEMSQSVSPSGLCEETATGLIQQDLPTLVPQVPDGLDRLPFRRRRQGCGRPPASWPGSLSHASEERITHS